jgi:hypothetical protein
MISNVVPWQKARPARSAAFPRGHGFECSASRALARSRRRVNDVEKSFAGQRLAGFARRPKIADRLAEQCADFSIRNVTWYLFGCHRAWQWYFNRAMVF